MVSILLAIFYQVSVQRTTATIYCKARGCLCCCYVFFTLYLQTEATPKQLLELLQLFKKISEAFKRATTDLDIFSVRCPSPSVIAFVSTHAISPLQMMYKVLVIIINCLNLDRLAGDETDLHVSPGGARLSALEKSPRGIDEINQEIAQPWANGVEPHSRPPVTCMVADGLVVFFCAAGAQAAVALAWAWFLTVFIRVSRPQCFISSCKWGSHHFVQKHGESDVANKRRVSEAWRKAKRQVSCNATNHLMFTGTHFSCWSSGELQLLCRHPAAQAL
jgi:hypothetical protein